MRNLITSTDSYKLSHFLQYPKGTTKSISYIVLKYFVNENTTYFNLTESFKEIRERAKL